MGIKISTKIKIFAFLFLCIFLLSSYPSNNQKEEIPLAQSSGNISAYFIDRVPDPKSETLPLILAPEEDEILNELPVFIIRGKIKKIRNIKIDMNGDIFYNSIAEIAVTKVLRGPEINKTTISVLLPGAWNTTLWQEDTNRIEEMRIGMEGIFFPAECNESSYLIRNYAKLMRADLAPYQLKDGMCFAILDTINGLKYNKFTFASLDSFTTLNQVEKYIMAKIS